MSEGKRKKSLVPAVSELNRPLYNKNLKAIRSRMASGEISWEKAGKLQLGAESDERPQYAKNLKEIRARIAKEAAKIVDEFGERRVFEKMKKIAKRVK